jgi:hypothetical protein
VNAEAKQPKSLWWFEPRRSYRPRLKKEVFAIIQIKMWLRIVAIVILLTVLLAYGLKRALPDFEFDWAAQLAQSIGVMVLGLVCFSVFIWFIPPIIGVTAKGVSRLQGQHASWRLRADIRRLTIDTTDQARPRLNIEATGKKPFECGIAAKVGAAALAAFLRATFPELAVEEKK